MPSVDIQWVLAASLAKVKRSVVKQISGLYFKPTLRKRESIPPIHHISSWRGI